MWGEGGEGGNRGGECVKAGGWFPLGSEWGAVVAQRPLGTHFWKVADPYMRICKRAMAQSITSAIEPAAVNSKASPVLLVILYSPRMCAKLHPCMPINKGLNPKPQTPTNPK